jgi:hypothetical protein
MFAENPQAQTTWRRGNSMSPFSADVGQTVPLPRTSLGFPHGVQSIEIKYFQEYVFGERFNRCPPAILACTAWVNNNEL